MLTHCKLCKLSYLSKIQENFLNIDLKMERYIRSCVSFVFDFFNFILKIWTICISWIQCLIKIVLYCIVLYCIVLYCIVLYCTVLYCIVLYWSLLRCCGAVYYLILSNFTFIKINVFLIFEWVIEYYHNGNCGGVSTVRAVCNSLNALICYKD